MSGKIYEMYAEMMLWRDDAGDEFCYRTYCLVSWSMLATSGTVCVTQLAVILTNLLTILMTERWHCEAIVHRVLVLF